MKSFSASLAFLVLFLSSACSNSISNMAGKIDGDTLEWMWTHETGAPINKPPVLVGDIVVAAPEYGPLLGIKLHTGQRAWEYTTPEGVWDMSYESDGRSVYFGVPGGKLVAIDARNGKLRWEQEIGIEVQAAPTVHGDVLYVPTTFVGPKLAGDPDGKAGLFAVRVRDGEILWRFESDGYILQHPFVLDGVVYTAGSYINPEIDVDEGGPMKVYALNASDGTLKWKYEAEDGYVKAIYATPEAVTYIAYQDFINGLDAESGDLIWRKDTGNWVPSLTGHGDVVYFGSANTVVRALNMSDGAAVWTYNITGGSFNYVLGAPVHSGDVLYILSQRGDIIGLDANNGTALWNLPTQTTSRVGLSVSEPWIFFGDQQGDVYAYRSR